MNSTIELSFRYSERDYVRAMRAHYSSRLRLRLDIFMAVFLAGIGAYLWRSPDSHGLAIGFVSISIIFALILISAFVVIPPLAFRREPKFHNDYSLTFSPEGIHFRTDNVDSQLQWSLYTRALVAAHSYVLYHGSRSFTVVPKRVFQSAQQREAFEQLLARNVPRIIRRDAV